MTSENHEDEEWDRTTIYVPDRHQFKSEIHRLRGEHEAIGEASMREVYRALFEAALANPNDVAEALDGGDG